MKNKIGIISIDVDKLSDYANLYGIESRGNQVYERALPRVLELLEKYGIKATFFVVGRDGLQRENKEIIRAIARAGHEVASHSMNHAHPFSSLAGKEKHAEISDSKKLLSDITGSEVVGFRAPSYDIDKEGVDLLIQNNYLYDSSIVPSFLMRFFKLFGGIRTARKIPGFGSPSSYFSRPIPQLFPGKKLMEIPIGVCPYIRFPFYGTPILLMGAKAFDLCYHLAKHRNNYFHYQLHAVELNGIPEDQISENFSVHPGLSIRLEKKLNLYDHIFKTITGEYDFLTIKSFIGKTELA